MPETNKADWERALKMDEKSLANFRRDIKTMRDGGTVENLTLENALRIETGLEQVIENKKKLISKLARSAFENALVAERIVSRIAASKAFIGEVGRNGYAIKIEGVDPSFLQQAFGRQVDEWQKIKEWQSGAKKDWISTKPRKGQRPTAEVKRWVKSVNPTEFFAKWDLSVDDDSLQIFYK